MVFIFDQMWGVLPLPKNCLKSKTCPMMVANVPHENIVKSVGLSACVFSLSISVSFPQTFLARREEGEEVVLSFGFVDHSFPTSPTGLTRVTCLLYLCRAGFPVVAHLLNLPLSIGLSHVPEAKCCDAALVKQTNCDTA